LVGCEKQFSTKEPQEAPLPKNHRKLQENHNVFNEYSRQNANAIDQFRPRTNHLLKEAQIVQSNVRQQESYQHADGSIMLRVTTGSTMGPCVIVGERAGEMLKTGYKI
jgi:hypothetical protein